eukprot:CAMPEP_0178380408 /NCGR_PEP_ID=MMETSP0689_2-20121128/5446_1 /TAXON_ID=160604 /ORGANISM="Amphidinium massartii, Strain CS-259" /LENGTH=920 /DNA_ID=CAMNT_0020000547 /DNA_START=33 /DNA_END=2791 /DNA_ORIENTATION=+
MPNSLEEEELSKFEEVSHALCAVCCTSIRVVRDEDVSAVRPSDSDRVRVAVRCIDCGKHCCQHCVGKAHRNALVNRSKRLAEERQATSRWFPDLGHLARRLIHRSGGASDQDSETELSSMICKNCDKSWRINFDSSLEDLKQRAAWPKRHEGDGPGSTPLALGSGLEMDSVPEQAESASSSQWEMCEERQAVKVLGDLQATFLKVGPLGDGERGLLWRFLPDLQRESDGDDNGFRASHTFPTILDCIMSAEAQKPIEFTVTSEAVLRDLEEVIGEDWTVQRQAFDLEVPQEGSEEGLQGPQPQSGSESELQGQQRQRTTQRVLLCRGDRLVPSIGKDGASRELPVKAYFHWLQSQLPEKLKFERPTFERIIHWAPKVKLDFSATLALCSALHRGEHHSCWTPAAREAVIEAICRALRDKDEAWPEADLCEAVASLLMSVAKAASALPKKELDPIKSAVLTRACESEQVATRVYYALRDATLVSPPMATSRRARVWLQAFKEDLDCKLHEDVRTRLHLGRDFFESWLENGFEALHFKGCFLLPMKPELEVIGVCREEGSEEMKSKAAPVRFALQVVKHGDGAGSELPRQQQGVFMKTEKEKDRPDALKQQLVASLIQLLKGLLFKDQDFSALMVKLELDKDFKLGTHSVQALWEGTALIEEVPEATTLANAKSKCGNIDKFLNSNAPSEKICNRHVGKVYAVSSAIWFTISFLLGLGDRHADNAMVTTDGTYLHIDYGHVLGSDPTFKKCCNRFISGTSTEGRADLEDIQKVLGVGKAHALSMDDLFWKPLGVTYKALRRHSHLLAQQLDLIRELSPESDTKTHGDLLVFVNDRCQPSLGDEDAMHYIENMVKECANRSSIKFHDKMRDVGMGRAHVGQVVRDGVGMAVNHVLRLATARGQRQALLPSNVQFALAAENADA